jgi:hypothetical protein
MGFYQNPNVHVPEFTASMIKTEALIENLGGKDLLELMIGASDFGCVYYPDQGLEFRFRPRNDGYVYKAQFVPMAHSSTLDSFYAPPTYELMFTFEQLRGLSFVMVKPYHCVTIHRPETLVKVFETTTKTTLSF